MGGSQELGRIRSRGRGIWSSLEKGGSAGAWQVCPIALGVIMEQPVSRGHWGGKYP